MAQEAKFEVVTDWLPVRIKELRHWEFDDMPPVTVIFGTQEDCIGIEARYHRAPKRVIEFSPGFIASCWKQKKGIMDWYKIERTLTHELIHAWVDWKGMWSDQAEGHNEAFLRKAYLLGLDLDATLDKYAEAREIHEKIKREAELVFPPIKEVKEDAPWDAFGPSLVYVGAYDYLLTQAYSY
jgi:hypothetical protein